MNKKQRAMSWARRNNPRANFHNITAKQTKLDPEWFRKEVGKIREKKMQQFRSVE